MSGKRSELTEVALNMVDRMAQFEKHLASKKPIPFGMEERPKPKDPFVVPLKRGG